MNVLLELEPRAPRSRQSDSKEWGTFSAPAAQLADRTGTSFHGDRKYASSSATPITTLMAPGTGEMAMGTSPQSLPTIDEVVFSLGPALPARLLGTAENPDWHFIPEEARRGIISGRIAVIGFEDEDPPSEPPEPSDLLIFVAPAVRVRRMSGDPNREYPHLTHGEMLASVVCRAWDIPYSYRDFLALVGSDGMPAQKRGATGSGSCYFRYDSREGLFLLQGRLPRGREGLTALQPAFEKALGETITVSIGQVPPHLYHLRAAAH